MSILPSRRSVQSLPIVEAAVFRPIDDPKVDQDDCRKAVKQLGQRIATGEPADALWPMCDRWLDEATVLTFRAARTHEVGGWSATSEPAWATAALLRRAADSIDDDFGDEVEPDEDD